MRWPGILSCWETLSSRIDATGLPVAEADLVAVLLRSLREAVRTFCLHHTGGESYQAFRATALRWEQQQRAFAEFHPKKKSMPGHPGGRFQMNPLCSMTCLQVTVMETGI